MQRGLSYSNHADLQMMSRTSRNRGAFGCASAAPPIVETTRVAYLETSTTGEQLRTRLSSLSDSESFDHLLAVLADRRLGAFLWESQTRARSGQSNDQLRCRGLD
jgi:hypothetical protein